MKRPILALAVLTLLAIAWAVRAENTAFPITLRQGKAETDEGSFGINRGKVVGEDHLVLVIDTDLHELRIQHVDDDTNLVETIAMSSFASFLSNGQFAAIVELIDWEIPNLGLNNGAALVKGVIRETSNSVTLTRGRMNGVLNDSTLGDTNSADAEFQIILKPSGDGFDADEFGL